MQIIPLSQTFVSKRQRTAMDKTKLNELKEKIAKQGILHPPVFWYDNLNDRWVLNAGERRLTAIQTLHAEGREVRCNNETIPPGHVPITLLDERLDEIGRYESELDENVAREDLSWQDRTRAYADLHNMRKLQNPSHTDGDTGRELIQRNLVPGNNPKHAQIVATQAVIIAQHLDNEKIAQARNPAEALSLIYQQEEERVMAALVKRRLAAVPEKPAIEIRNGDCIPILDGLDSNLADLICADPPYGIDAGSDGARARTVHHHNYEDTPELAKKVAQAILVEGFRVCKARANLFLFCDIDLFPWLKLTAQNMGWTPFRTPLTWQKSESEGLAPWGKQGPRRTVEWIFYATKGQRGLNASPVDLFNIKRVPRTERVHAAEKPVELMKALIQCSTLPGDFVLDPCCGSGSTLVAAKELKRCGLGIEKDKDYYNSAMSNVLGRET